MTLWRKSLLGVSCCALLLRTANVMVAANPSCEPSNRRTISLRVENKAGATIDNLRGEDLVLFEDKTSREILQLESKPKEPLSIAILIDTSVSQERSLPETRLAAQKFVELVMHETHDQAAVVSFTGEPKVEQSLTNDLTCLGSAISRVEFVPPEGYRGGGIVVGRNPPISSSGQAIAGSTAIWDTVSATSTGMLKAGANSRRVIVLLTDGEDTASHKKLSEAIADAVRTDIAVFAIGIGDTSYGGVNRDSLNKLSDETGGRAFFPKKDRELSELLAQIEQELQYQYLLTYCTASPGTNAASQLSRIKIQLKRPASDLRLLYRHYGW
jgi:Ca-activated chloride channel family protein